MSRTSIAPRGKDNGGAVWVFDVLRLLQRMVRNVWSLVHHCRWVVADTASPSGSPIRRSSLA